MQPRSGGFVLTAVGYDSAGRAIFLRRLVADSLSEPQRAVFVQMGFRTDTAQYSIAESKAPVTSPAPEGAEPIVYTQRRPLSISEKLAVRRLAQWFWDHRCSGDFR